MKKGHRKPKSAQEAANDEILPEYDFSTARPNPYVLRKEAGGTIVLLDPDVAKDFPDSESVNDVLRALSAIIKRRSKSRRSA